MFSLDGAGIQLGSSREKRQDGLGWDALGPGMRDAGAHGLVGQLEILLGDGGKSQVTVVPIPCFLQGLRVRFPAPPPLAQPLQCCVIAQRDPNFEVCRGEGYELPSLPAACIHLPVCGVLRPPKLVFWAGASCASVSPSVRQA